MDKIIAEGKKGNLAIRITEMGSAKVRLINNVHVEQLNEKTFKVSIDFNKDPDPHMSCNVSTGDGWDGIDYQNDIDHPGPTGFSWMDVMFKWMGKGKSDLEMKWSTYETGDDTDRVHFDSLFISEILVTQVTNREDGNETLTMKI